MFNKDRDIPSYFEDPLSFCFIDREAVSRQYRQVIQSAMPELVCVNTIARQKPVRGKGREVLVTLYETKYSHGYIYSEIFRKNKNTFSRDIVAFGGKNELHLNDKGSHVALFNNWWLPLGSKSSGSLLGSSFNNCLINKARHFS